MTPRRDSDALLKWWPLVVALVAVVGWATTGVFLAQRADEANAKQWQAIGDLKERVARMEGHH